MSSRVDEYTPNITVEFIAIVSVKAERFKRNGNNYTNVSCSECGEWWVMVSMGKMEYIYCPYCGAKLEYE
jgi:DNA-directed RNA polymerase subunit RPC12/RpoP